MAEPLVRAIGSTQPQETHLTTTPSSPDDGGPNIGVIVAGVLVPLIVIGIGLLVFYIWYRKKYPVRMVFGKDFAKFTNPLYQKRPSTLTLVREDAHRFWEENETGLDGPASETDVEEEAKVRMEASDQKQFKSPSGISLVIEDWRAIESGGSSGLNTEEISQSNKQRKLSHGVNYEIPLDQSDIGKVTEKKRIPVDKNLLEGLRRHDSMETKKVKKVHLVAVESTENNIVFQQSVEVEQKFAEVSEKSTKPIHFDDTAPPESTANNIVSQQSTDVEQNVAEVSENKVIKLNPFEEKVLESEIEENDTVEEKEKQDSDKYIESGTHRNDEPVMDVNIQQITNGPTGSMKIPNNLKMHANELSGSINISTNTEVLASEPPKPGESLSDKIVVFQFDKRQKDPPINSLREPRDDGETLESTETNKKYIFDKASHPMERQLDVSFVESVHVSRCHGIQDKQVLLQIPVSEQRSDPEEEAQLQKQFHQKDLTWASIEDVHQLTRPKDELGLTDLYTDEEDIEKTTAEVTEQSVMTLITTDLDEEIDDENVEYNEALNSEALSTSSIQTEAEIENRVENRNIVRETQQCSDNYGQLNPNIQHFGEFSSSEWTLENSYSEKAKLTPQDANADQDEEVRADSKGSSTSESGSSGSSFDVIHEGTSCEKKGSPSLDIEFLVKSSGVSKENMSPSLTFEKLETVHITPNVSGGKFAEEQFEKIDSVRFETDVLDILDKDVELISSSSSVQSAAEGFNVEMSIPVTDGYVLDNINRSNLNKIPAKSYKADQFESFNSADVNSLERRSSDKLKKIKVSFKDFDSSSSDSDDSSSNDSDEKSEDNTLKEHNLNDPTKTDGQTTLKLLGSTQNYSIPTKMSEHSDLLPDKDDQGRDIDSAQFPTQGFDYGPNLGAGPQSEGLQIETDHDDSGGSNLTTMMTRSTDSWEMVNDTPTKLAGYSSEDVNSIITSDNDDTTSEA